MPASRNSSNITIFAAVSSKRPVISSIWVTWATFLGNIHTIALYGTRRQMLRGPDVLFDVSAEWESGRGPARAIDIILLILLEPT